MQSIDMLRRIFSDLNSDITQISFVMLHAQITFAKMYIFLSTLFPKMAVKRYVENDKLRFQPEIICNAVCDEFLKKYGLIFTT